MTPFDRLPKSNDLVNGEIITFEKVAEFLFKHEGKWIFMHNSDSVIF